MRHKFDFEPRKEIRKGTEPQFLKSLVDIRIGMEIFEIVTEKGSETKWMKRSESALT